MKYVMEEKRVDERQGARRKGAVSLFKFVVIRKTTAK